MSKDLGAPSGPCSPILALVVPMANWALAKLAKLCSGIPMRRGSGINNRGGLKVEVLICLFEPSSGFCSTDLKSGLPSIQCFRRQDAKIVKKS